MSLLDYIVLGAILCLAIWKLYELFFGTIASRRLKETETALALMSMFFAEFTYKTMNNSDTYEDAPKEIYNWINKNFEEWGNYRTKSGK